MFDAQKSFDLEERTARFGEEVIKLCQKLTINEISKPIINQLVRSATSVGANYMEANGASSKKDFRNKVYILLACCFPAKKTELAVLWQEAKELSMIFHKIATSATGN